MAVNNILGTLVLTEISTDNLVWKTLVCEQTSKFDISAAVTKEKTKCGPVTATGEPEWTFSGTALVNSKPSATQVSYREMVGFVNNQTKIWVRAMSPVDVGLDLDLGEAFFQGGEGLVSSVSGEYSEGTSIKFDWTIEGQGELITTLFAIVTQPPATLGVTAPAALTISVVVAGGDQPLAYQWQKDGVDLVGNGATTATYSKTPSVAGTDSGSYTCEIEDEGGAFLETTACVVTVS